MGEGGELLVAGGLVLFEGGEFGGAFAADGGHRRVFCVRHAAARRQHRCFGARRLVIDKPAFVDGLRDLFEGLVGLGVELNFVVKQIKYVDYFSLFI